MDNREYLEKLEEQKKWMIHPDRVTDHTRLASGTFESGAEWIIYASGQLVVRGDGAMDSYSSVSETPWYVYRKEVTSLEIQPGITSVSAYAFSGFPNLEKVIIANTVTDIGYRAFNECKALTQVKLPVDYDFTITEEQYNPDEPGDGIFRGCENVNTIHYTYGQTGEMRYRGSADQDPCFYYGHTLEYNCRENLVTVYFDPGITIIAARAFAGCEKLQNINVPDELTSIGDLASTTTIR